MILTEPHPLPIHTIAPSHHHPIQTSKGPTTPSFLPPFPQFSGNTILSSPHPHLMLLHAQLMARHLLSMETHFCLVFQSFGSVVFGVSLFITVALFILLHLISSPHSVCPSLTPSTSPLSKTLSKPLPKAPKPNKQKKQKRKQNQKMNIKAVGVRKK